MAAWVKSKDEFVKRAGYTALAHLAKREDDSLTDTQFETHLKRIEREIHQSPNRAREAMNSALIAIGKRNPRLHPLALAAARRIGPVLIEHGKDTNCRDVDAVERLEAFSF